MFSYNSKIKQLCKNDQNIIMVPIRIKYASFHPSLDPGQEYFCSHMVFIQKGVFQCDFFYFKEEKKGKSFFSAVDGSLHPSILHCFPSLVKLAQGRDSQHFLSPVLIELILLLSLAWGGTESYKVGSVCINSDANISESQGEVVFLLLFFFKCMCWPASVHVCVSAQVCGSWKVSSFGTGLS